MVLLQYHANFVVGTIALNAALYLILYIGDASEDAERRRQWNISIRGYDKALDALRKEKGMDWEEREAENLDMQKSLFKNKAVCNLKLAMSHSQDVTKMIYFQVMIEHSVSLLSLIHI